MSEGPSYVLTLSQRHIVGKKKAKVKRVPLILSLPRILFGAVSFQDHSQEKARQTKNENKNKKQQPKNKETKRRRL